ncbi:MAG: HIT family protein [Candidatus Dormibacteria bacterium]
MAASVVAAAAVVTGAAAGAVSGCVFCDRSKEPAPLLEGRDVHLIPDLFPVVPGHLLLVSREHLPAYGAAPPEVLAELEELSAVAMDFVHRAYGVEPLLWENGGAGQTVFHAHLHVMPVALPALEDVIHSEEMTEVAGVGTVADYWRTQGPYHYLQFQGHRRIAEGNGSANWEFRRRVAIAAGLRYQEGRWVRPTTLDDVGDVTARWGAFRKGEVTGSA